MYVSLLLLQCYIGQCNPSVRPAHDALKSIINNNRICFQIGLEEVKFKRFTISYILHYVHIYIYIYIFTVITENTTLKASPLRNCHVILTCQHHNRNDIAFNAKSTFWKKNNGSFVEYLEGVVMNKNEETVLSIMAEYGDSFICAMKLQNGGLEESNTITIQRLNHQCKTKCHINAHIIYIHIAKIIDVYTYSIICIHKPFNR